jgi:lipopolysaccharide transport system ATP-binding protein
MAADLSTLPPDLAIRVDGLSKEYSIGVRARAHDTVREQVTAAVKSFFRDGFRRAPSRAHLALDDVSFDVRRGQVVGIIGGNGAGKSTLLKILSRVTVPSAGVAQIRGRVGALLEVGCGFHPELTGRENVFLNGAMLGMTRAEVRRKFDQIVDFSEIPQFIDTPVKRYSSGMYVRLAFAVAAHLEPDILIVDEALAVGDIAFQRKCLGQLESQAGSGRTVLFVSHNLGAIRMLCQRCLLLQGGRLVLDGPADDVIERYIHEIGNRRRSSGTALQPDVGDGFVLRPRDPIADLTLRCGDAMMFDFDVEAARPPVDRTVGIGIKITTPSGEPIVSMDSVVQGAGCIRGDAARWNVRCDLGRLPLNAGTYFVWVFVCVYVNNTVRHYAQFSNAFTLHVLEHDVFGWGTSLPRPRYWGPLYWAPQWRFTPQDRAVGVTADADMTETLACRDSSAS